MDVLALQAEACDGQGNASDRDTNAYDDPYPQLEGQVGLNPPPADLDGFLSRVIVKRR